MFGVYEKDSGRGLFVVTSPTPPDLTDQPTLAAIEIPVDSGVTINSWHVAGGVAASGPSPT